MKVQFSNKNLSCLEETYYFVCVTIDITIKTTFTIIEACSVATITTLAFHYLFWKWKEGVEKLLIITTTTAIVIIITIAIRAEI